MKATVVVTGELTDLAAWAFGDRTREQQRVIRVPRERLAVVVDRLLTLGLEVADVRPASGPGGAERPGVGR